MAIRHTVSGTKDEEKLKIGLFKNKQTKIFKTRFQAPSTFTINSSLVFIFEFNSSVFNSHVYFQA